MSTTAMDLKLGNLSKRFGDKLAVEIPALTIRQGEFFTFVGPSGCGKSTTLNLIAGLEAPDSGTLWLGDRRLNDLPPHQRDVAFVFQTYALYPHRTVRENLSFPLELAGQPAEERRRRVEEAAAWLGITPLLDKRPRQLSGGERQRVALGRAMVRQPKLFLFDEPLSNLDAPLRAQMRKELRRLHQELETTFVYVTHDQEEALSLSDRIAVMQGGRLQQCGDPREIYERPANTFVAGFFGSPPINLLPARMTGAAQVELGGRRLPEIGLPADHFKAESVTVGVRPEHIRLGRDPLPEGWQATVLLTEMHGGTVYLELDCGSFRLTATASAEAGFAQGEALWAGFDIARLHLFDAGTGERLAARGEEAAS